MFDLKLIQKLKELNRGQVIDDYNSAIKKNEKAYTNGDVKATSEYTYPNQKEDALNICNILINENKKVCSVIKKTKVGADGLIIELLKNMNTHPDDEKVLEIENSFIITGMNNKKWQTSLEQTAPNCFIKNIKHHGQLQKINLNNIKNGIIIIDEIDTGDKENQKLHKILKNSNLLDVNVLKERNIYLIFISATNYIQLQELYKWGDDIHFTYIMTIPDNYIGHKEFLELGIIQEFYPINNEKNAERWIKEDIINNYGNDYRVHIIRIDEKNSYILQYMCNKYNINYKNHTSKERITDDDFNDIFSNINNHLVITIRGLFRRADLIPNKYKLLIGATHEKYVDNYDTNVQVQGLPGRMSGYWKNEILNGHKTGPHRCSIEAIKEYNKFYENPFVKCKYNANISKKPFVNPVNIINLQVKEEEKIITNKRVPVVININEDNEDNELFTNYSKLNKKKKIEITLSIINNNKYKKLYDFINNSKVECKQITKPDPNKSSYKKHIIDVVNAFENKKEYSIDLNDKYKTLNNWQLFIDSKEKRLCFVIWCIDKDLYLG